MFANLPADLGCGWGGVGVGSESSRRVGIMCYGVCESVRGLALLLLCESNQFDFPIN